MLDNCPTKHNLHKMRTLIWASALQADILALALQLDQDPEQEVLIAATGIAAYQTQLIAQKRPFQCEIIERSDESTCIERVLAFDADVCVVDNHFPKQRLAKATCKMWHGLGWKAPDRMDTYFDSVEMLTGLRPDVPNPRFMAMCYGPHDKQFRIDGMHIHKDNCSIVGMPMADLIVRPPYDRHELAPRYKIDVLGQQTVLINFTWHYGSITSHGGPGFWQKLFKSSKPNKSDAAFLDQICQAVITAGANVLFCMHDRKRYEATYLEIFERLKQRYQQNIQIKFKDEHPDNLSDLLVSDVMVSNLSSFITFFYHTGKPTVHLSPVKEGQRAVQYARASRKGVRYKKRGLDQAFMMEPSDNGGFTAYNREQCIEQILQGLANPNSCSERIQAYLKAKLPNQLPGSEFSASAEYVKALDSLHQRASAAEAI